MITEILEALAGLLFCSYCGFYLRIGVMKLVWLIASSAFVVAAATSLWTQDERVWQVALWVSGLAGIAGVFSKEFRRSFSASKKAQASTALVLFFAPLLASAVVSALEN